MIQMTAFIAHENIRRFKAQILVAAEEARKDTICELLATEERLLREHIAESV
jgi:hypothetical protein